jgi:hypothetical protein
MVAKQAHSFQIKQRQETVSVEDNVVEVSNQIGQGGTVAKDRDTVRDVFHFCKKCIYFCKLKIANLSHVVDRMMTMALSGLCHHEVKQMAKSRKLQVKRRPQD